MTYSESDALGASAADSRPDTSVPLHPLAPAAPRPVSPVGYHGEEAAQAVAEQLSSLRSLLARHLTATPDDAAETGPQSLESLVNMLYDITASPAAETTQTVAEITSPAGSAPSFTARENGQADAPGVRGTPFVKAAQPTEETAPARNGAPVKADAKTAETQNTAKTAEAAAEETAQTVQPLTQPSSAVSSPVSISVPIPVSIPAIIEPAQSAPLASAEAAKENVMSATTLERDSVEEAMKEHTPIPAMEHVLEPAPPALTNGAKNGASSLPLPSSPVSAPAEAPAGSITFTLTSGGATAALNVAPQTNVSAIVLEQRPDSNVLKLEIAL